MELVDGADLIEEEGLVPLDFSDDYRQSGTFQAELLPLPGRAAVVAAVQATMSLPADVIDQVMTALAAGRHLLLYGPPGTGKTSLAKAIAAAYECEPIAHTASADWTAFETAGGLQLTFTDGAESLEPTAGIITKAVVRCLNHVAAEKAGKPTSSKAAWLIIDELNRANVDAAFGPYFNALDPDHYRVTLPFMDEARSKIDVPARFRVIGTMNTYDKNFLFRLSYALTRRFALVEVGVPANDDEPGRQQEGLGVLQVVSQLLNARGIAKTPIALGTEYEQVLTLLYDRLVTQIRSDGSAGLGRGIGFAQIAAAFGQTCLACELNYGEPDADDARKVDALDRAITASIVPQLEGLPNSKLKAFTDWWANDGELLQLRRSLTATRALISGLDLFIADAE